ASAAYAPNQRPSLLPARLVSNRICLVDGRLVAASRRSWKSIDVDPALDPDDPIVAAIFADLGATRRRSVLPERRIVVEDVNGSAAAGGPFESALAACGFERDRGRMVLW
ncbi:MAG TPA: hypothetical protein VMC79_12710, partial [Rectinemataceae bacterium]|nr:hypothetical protein [Rectinemataceae bacterium]